MMGLTAAIVALVLGSASAYAGNGEDRTDAGNGIARRHQDGFGGHDGIDHCRARAWHCSIRRNARSSLDPDTSAARNILRS